MPPVFKRGAANVEGRTAAINTQSPMTSEKPVGSLMGEANETDIGLEGVICKALLDTGSTVSTVSQGFYDEHLSHLQIHPLDDILHIETAGGSMLPYAGYIEADVTVPGLFEGDTSTILLVVPNTEYSKRVPVLLGTNLLRPIMDNCREKHGTQFRQKIAMSTPWWLTFRYLHVEDKAVSRANGRLALVKSAERFTVTIPANRRIMMTGFVSDEVPCRRLAMVHSTEKTVLPSGVEITPSLMNYKGDNSGEIAVEISNPTRNPVVIPPSGLLGELQEVTVVDSAEEIVTETDKNLLDVEVETLANTAKDDGPEMSAKEIFFKRFNLDTTGLTADQPERVYSLLWDYQDIFSAHDLDIGHTDTVKHRIDLNDETPFKQRHRRIPPSMYDEVKDHLQQLLKGGIIRESNSPFSSAIVLVRKKKTGKLRMCVDFRQLNNRTIKDSYALPRIDEILDHLKGATYFTSLDMRSGYYQVELEPEHQERTAFTVGPLGFYECVRMPFGLTNAPATFQRLMERVMEEIHMKECVTFIDDVIVHGTDFDQHLERLEHVFQKIRKHNLKLNPEKCEFLKRKVVYCGHVVSDQGIETDPAKIAEVQQMEAPTNVEEVRRFIGLTGYYRKFVKDYAKIARPLTDLLMGPRKKKTKGKGRPAVSQQPPPEWRWGPEQQTAFETLKERLISPPILAYADFSLPFILHCDASQDGLGAVLCQNQDGQEKVIAYASRTLSRSERHYPVHKQEFLALKWAITEKFHDYLYGQDFTALTDNNPLTYVLTTAKLDAAGHRWLATLASYHFNIKYRPGHKNLDADALSRLPRRFDVQQDSEGNVELSTEVVGAVCSSLQHRPLVETFCLSAQPVIGEPFEEFNLGVRNWRIAQREDPTIRYFLQSVTNGTRPDVRKLPPGTETQQLLKNFGHLTVQRGVLYRKTKVDEQEKLRLVLPRKYRNMAIQGCHDDVGHLGRDRTLQLLRDRFYWPKMYAEVEDWIKRCERCVLRKTPTTQRAPLVNIKTSQPMELVCTDFLTLETSKGGYHHILVITDHFTRYAQAVPTRNMTAKTTAEAIWQNYLVHYGFPKKLHSDQGANFESRLVKELCKLAGVKKTRTTPYHAMGDGATERFNRTLLNMLGTLNPDEKPDWKAHISPLVHAYNATRHDSTARSPFFLMFGREPRLAVDLVLGVPEEEGQPTYCKYVEALRKRLQEAYKLATAEIEKAQSRQKRNYDRKVRGAVLEAGDRVLVEILAFEGKHKIADRWEPNPYIVLEQPCSAVPVFVVQREDESGPKRTLHRNHLLPIGSLPFSETDVDPEKEPKIKAPIPSTELEMDAASGEETESSDSEPDLALLEIADDDDDDNDVGSRKPATEHQPAGEEEIADIPEQQVDQMEHTDDEELTSDEELPQGAVHESASEAEEETSHEEEETFQEGEEETFQEGEEETFQEGEEEASEEEEEIQEDASQEEEEMQDLPKPEDMPADHESPVPTLRKSSRVKKKPAWFKSGDYVTKRCQERKTEGSAVNKDAPASDWEKRAQFLASLAKEDSLPMHVREDVCKTILQIISK